MNIPFINTIRNIREKLWHTKDIRAQLENLKFEIVRSGLQEKIMHSTRSGISSTRYCGHDIVVSLTTHGKRIYDVAITIESIMQQTMLPNRIILNIDRSFENIPLPLSLQRQTTRGLEIRTVDDIKSYKKLIPTLQACPDDIIITIDDDLVYDYDIIERLYRSYLQHPDSINALRTHTIRFGSDGKPMKYNDWYLEKAISPNPFHLFPTTGGGTLFPSGCFNNEIFNRDVFTRICPTADDVWVHAMAVLNGTKIVKALSRSDTGCDYLVNHRVQDIGLHLINTGTMRNNDRQIEAVYSRYGIYDLLNHSCGTASSRMSRGT